MLVYLFTDGGSRNHGNHAGQHVKKTDPSAYAYAIKLGKSQKALAGTCAYHGRTNSQMELGAVVMGLKFILDNFDPDNIKQMKIIVVSDSQYVVNAFNKSWIFKWYANGFKGIKNAKIWKLLLIITTRFPSLSFKWVRGHQEDKKDLLHCGNCAVDHLLNKAMDTPAWYVNEK